MAPAPPDQQDLVASRAQRVSQDWEARLVALAQPEQPDFAALQGRRVRQVFREFAGQPDRLGHSVLLGHRVPQARLD